MSLFYPYFSKIFSLGRELYVDSAFSLQYFKDVAPLSLAYIVSRNNTQERNMGRDQLSSNSLKPSLNSLQPLTWRVGFYSLGRLSSMAQLPACPKGAHKTVTSHCVPCDLPLILSRTAVTIFLCRNIRVRHSITIILSLYRM